MKIIFSALLIFFSVTVTAQKAKAVTNEELKALVGKWGGSMVSTGFTDGKSQLSFSTALEVIDMKDSLLFNYTYTDAEGKQSTEKSIMHIYDDGNRLSFDSAQFDIVETRRRGVRVTMYAEREGHDNYRPADYQYIFIFGQGILNITKGIRYADMVDYSILKRSTLTKK
jgi:hypothetical protein